uniref:Uncharacterized protein n=1 Tax=Labrus bergylta TaxID=56723 RepID=A0A3Q3GI90_9LABR
MAYLIIVVFFLLPLFILVLHMGRLRWRKQHSAAAISHSDFFTYNMVAMEIFSLSGCGLYQCGVYADDRALLMAGVYLFSITAPGQTMFHVLTFQKREEHVPLCPQGAPKFTQLNVLTGALRRSLCSRCLFS